MPATRTFPRQLLSELNLPWWPDWVIEAACRDYDPEMFFELGSNGRNTEAIRKAKAVCYSCPVIRECIKDNIEIPFGIVGGMTPAERWKILRRKGRPSHMQNAFSSSGRYYGKSGKWQELPPRTRYDKSASELIQNWLKQNGRGIYANP